jgi:RHS repeat-associated protein
VFGWDGDRLAYESAGLHSTHYVYEAGPFAPLAQFVASRVDGIETPQRKESDRYAPEDDPLMNVPVADEQAQVYYYHCDVIGTPQILTDDAGEVVWEARYKAWGEAVEVIARVSGATREEVRNPIRFQGQQADDETGLHYNRYWYYDPRSGRFISKDPIGLLGGVNAFQYAPNPTGWIDPLGLARCPCDPCSKYDVGPFNQLKQRSAPGDDLDIHHAMQKQPAPKLSLATIHRRPRRSLFLPMSMHKSRR